MNRSQLISLCQSVNAESFDRVALALFRYQYQHNAIYKSWVDAIGCDVSFVEEVTQIPSLPISAFKQHEVVSHTGKGTHVFTSSGTTGATPSRHIVYDMEHYLHTAQAIFESQYGLVSDYCFLALLPSYLERSGSSLIAMVERFVQESKYDNSGFYLYEHDALHKQLLACKAANIPTVLFGVSFALLDLIESFQLDYPSLTIIETGGMKGRKQEISRTQLHDQIAAGFGVTHVHSEYGMTELFSQAYSQRDGIFVPGHTMQVRMREITDPLSNVDLEKTGIINIIDLANVDSCAFIETQDLGKLYADGTFEVLGRLDQSDIRGCNLMVSEV